MCCENFAHISSKIGPEDSEEEGGMKRGNRLSRMNIEFHIFVDFVTWIPDLAAKCIPLLYLPYFGIDICPKKMYRSWQKSVYIHEKEGNLAICNNMSKP